MGMQFKDPNTDSKGRQILTQNTLLTEVVDEVHKAKEKNKAGYLNKKLGNDGLWTQLGKMRHRWKQSGKKTRQETKLDTQHKRDTLTK